MQCFEASISASNCLCICTGYIPKNTGCTAGTALGRNQPTLQAGAATSQSQQAITEAVYEDLILLDPHGRAESQSTEPFPIRQPAPHTPHYSTFSCTGAD